MSELFETCYKYMVFTFPVVLDGNTFNISIMQVVITSALLAIIAGFIGRLRE